MVDKNTSSGETGHNRRSVLKTAGLSIGGFAAIPSTSRAYGRDPEKIIEQSHKVLQATDSVEKQHKFLRNRGFSTGYDRNVYQMPVGQSSGQIGTLEYDKDDLEIALSLFIDCSGDGTYTAELGWSYHVDERGPDSGAKPIDVPQIGWYDTQWDYEVYNYNDTTYTSQYVSYYDGSISSGPGMAYKMDDYQAYADHNEDWWHYGGLHLEPKGDASESERVLQASYTHSWNEGQFDGVSLGIPAGMSASFKYGTVDWRTDSERDGDMLRVNQSQASAQNCY